MRVAVFVIAAAMAADIGCATLPPCPARGGPAWHAYSTEHFELRTDLGTEDAEEVVRTLEETRAAMLTMVWAGLPGPRQRTQVIVLASNQELAAFTGFGVGGMYFHGVPFPPTMVFAGTSFRGVDALKHELAHDLSSWFLPFQPLWYSEGIATFLETIRYDRAQQRAFVGEPSQERYRAIQHRGILDVERLLGSNPTDVFELSDLESSSWILVHYLLNHKDEAFGRFQRRLGAMEPATRAWRGEFPDLDPATLQNNLVQYAYSGQYVVSVRTLAPWQGKADVRSMPDAEVHGVRAYLYSYLHQVGEDTKQAEASAEIDEAMSAERAPIDALAMAFYRRDAKNEMVRSELARRAVDTHPDSWLAWIMVADTSDPTGAAHQTALGRALARAPDEGEVLARMAIVKASKEQWDEALSFSSMALRRRAVRLDLWMVHLTALTKTGQCAEAALWATAVLGFLPPREAEGVSKRWSQLRQACVSAPESKPIETDSARGRTIRAGSSGAN